MEPSTQTNPSNPTANTPNRPSVLTRLKKNPWTYIVLSFLSYLITYTIWKFNALIVPTPYILLSLANNNIREITENPLLAPVALKTLLSLVIPFSIILLAPLKFWFRLLLGLTLSIIVWPLLATYATMPISNMQYNQAVERVTKTNTQYADIPFKIINERIIPVSSTLVKDSSLKKTLQVDLEMNAPIKGEYGIYPELYEKTSPTTYRRVYAETIVQENGKAFPRLEFPESYVLTPGKHTFTITYGIQGTSSEQPTEFDPNIHSEGPYIVSIRLGGIKVEDKTTDVGWEIYETYKRQQGKKVVLQGSLEDPAVDDSNPSAFENPSGGSEFILVDQKPSVGFYAGEEKLYETIAIHITKPYKLTEFTTP
jgi:hypothetical protein